VGLLEMVKFGKEFFGRTVHAGTFTEESAGVADLITSCSGGRNFRCAKMAVAEGISVDEVEARELNGQKLQGTSTAVEVNSFLRSRGLEAEYPLFTAVYSKFPCRQNLPADDTNNGADILKGKKTVDDIPDLLARADDQPEY